MDPFRANGECAMILRQSDSGFEVWLAIACLCPRRTSQVVTALGGIQVQARHAPGSTDAREWGRRLYHQQRLAPGSSGMQDPLDKFSYMRNPAMIDSMILREEERLWLRR
jgi:hypothetical protein